MSEIVKNAAPHSVWLCPTDQSARQLSAVIKAYADRAGVPTFAPHVTVLGDVLGAPSDTAKACRAAFAEVGPITSKVTALSSTSSFFMAHFLDVAVPQNVISRRTLLAEALGGASPGTFRPHVSLVYGAEAATISKKDTAELTSKFVGRSIVFDRLAIVASAKNIPIERWHEVDSIAL